jgi:hypothetical protein
LLREPLDSETVELKVLNPAIDRINVSSSLGRTGSRDDGPFWANDLDLGALPIRDDASSDIELTHFSLAGRRSRSVVDAIPPDSAYRYVQFSAGDQFLAYAKGVYPNYDAAYVDLRYDTIHDPKPVRVPGEGVLYSLNFGSDGLSLYYVRELENGARTCFYLDLSAQVAADPVKISRDGRVDYCESQAPL